MSEEKPPPSNTVTIRVKADSMQYTRRGLQPRQVFPLKLGTHTQIVVERPARLEPIGPGYCGFPVDHSFPTAGTLALSWRYGSEGSAFSHGEETKTPPDGLVQLFAHADRTGDEAHNKQLTDRRGEVARALLLGDLEAFTQVAQLEDWGTRHEQAMLRILGCDPGLIDGELGPTSARAVEQFQRRYVEGDFHRRSPEGGPAIPDLAADGDLGPQTRRALLDAFVCANAAHLTPDRLHPTHPANGCSEFNLASEDHAGTNRRISLIVHRELPPHHDNAPCKAGDDAACAVVDNQRQRCLWYRLHVAEDVVDAPRFFDPRWLSLEDGRYVLSALTTAADEDEVEFEVFDSDVPLHGAAAGPASASTLLGDGRLTTPILGIAQVVWTPPPELGTDDTGRPAVQGVPVFRVRHPASGSFSFATWPETHDVRILMGATDADGAYPGDRPESFRLRSTDGRYEQVVPLEQATRVSPHHFAVEFPNAPVGSRYTLSCDFHGESVFDVTMFDDVPLEELRDSCSEGRLCREVPPPSDPKPVAEDDHPDAIVSLLDPDDDVDVTA